MAEANDLTDLSLIIHLFIDICRNSARMQRSVGRGDARVVTQVDGASFAAHRAAARRGCEPRRGDAILTEGKCVYELDSGEVCDGVKKSASHGVVLCDKHNKAWRLIENGTNGLAAR